jgi:hypothetical protein
MSGHGHGLKRAAAGLAVVLAAAGTAAGTASAAPAATAGKTSGVSAPRGPALPKTGIWTVLSTGMAVESPAPALWMAPNGIGWDVFARQVGPSNFTYEAVRLGPGGAVASGPTDIFKIHWGSLQFGPTLLGDGAVPVLVFSGLRGTTGPYARGCVYGAVGGAGAWTVQPWSLSSDCLNPVSAAAERTNSGSVLAAAWPGGWVGGTGINYRIGVSPVIPAPPPDKHIPVTKATAIPTGMANDMAGSGHFFVAWNQVFSVPGSRDGVYVQDVTAGGPVRKAPNTGTFTVSNDFPVFARLATMNSNFHSGVFLAYCANVAPCRLLLWRVGALKPIPVPLSGDAFGVSLAQGPQGRIWVAWVNHATNRVFVTRTNKADTRFGAVESYAAPCFEDGLLGLAGSPLNRLDVGMSCVNNVSFKQAEYLTQVRAGLTLGFATPVHVPSGGLNIKITVSDAGDPVAGATVTLDGKTAKTNSSGQVTIHLTGGIKTGKYTVTATAVDYLLAAGTLTVK